MYVCICHAVTERAIHKAVAEGVSSIGELTQATGLGSCCGSCRELGLSVLQDALALDTAAPIAA